MKRIRIIFLTFIAVIAVATGGICAQAMPRAAVNQATAIKAAARVVIAPKTASVYVGSAVQLKATVIGVQGGAVEWRVERGADVCEVDENGLVTGVKPGSAYIRATDRLTGQSALRKVAVKAVRVKQVTLKETAIVIERGEAFEMTAPTITPANATVTTAKWSTGNSRIAVVDGEGRVTGVSAGTTRVTCTVDGKTASCQVRVRGQSTTITLSAAGDVILGGDPRMKSALNRVTEQVFKQLIGQYGFDYPFKNVAGVFRADDVSIVNLEGTLTTAGGAKNKTHTFRGDPGYAKMLKNAGIEVCNLANNHSNDFKAKGLSETQKSLNGEGIRWCDHTENGTYTMEKDGISVKIGFAGFQTPVASGIIQKRVKELKKKCDVVVATFHWCDTKEWTAKNYASDRSRAKTAISAGADLVLGHHRHVPAGIETYKGKYIVFDLSNFIVGIKHKADSGGRPLTDSMIFQWTFRIDSLGVIENEGIKVIPCTTTTSTETYPATDGFGDLGAPINNWQPAILHGEAAEGVLSRIRALSTVPIPMG